MAKKKAEKPQAPTLSPTLEWETRAGYPRVALAGVDEVGRGCLAGPVVAAAIVLPAVVDYERDPWLLDVSDSKAVRAEERERLAPLIESWAAAHCVASASVAEIDRLNIYHASHLAMCRAIEGLGIAPAHVLVDGKFSPPQLRIPATAIVKGDLKCLSIAGASILAKVWRDRHMAELDRSYPGYGFAVHKGYPTPAHSQALRRQGACDQHRRSFAPVREVIESGSLEQGSLFS